MAAPTAPPTEPPTALPIEPPAAAPPAAPLRTPFKVGLPAATDSSSWSVSSLSTFISKLVMVLALGHNDRTMGVAGQAREPRRASRDIPTGIRGDATNNDFKLLVGQSLGSSIFGFAFQH